MARAGKRFRPCRLRALENPGLQVPYRVAGARAHLHALIQKSRAIHGGQDGSSYRGGNTRRGQGRSYKTRIFHRTGRRIIEAGEVCLPGAESYFHHPGLSNSYCGTGPASAWIRFGVGNLHGIAPAALKTIFRFSKKLRVFSEPSSARRGLVFSR